MIQGLRKWLKALEETRELRDKVTVSLQSQLAKYPQYSPSLKRLAKDALRLEKSGQAYHLSATEHDITETYEFTHRCWSAAHGDMCTCGGSECYTETRTRKTGIEFHVTVVPD
jgi:hypothetical protein